MKLHISNRTTLEHPSSEIRYQLEKYFTIPNPKFVEAQKYGRSTKGIDRSLKLYESTPKGISFPRGATRDILQLAEVCEMHDYRRSLPDLELLFQGKLRPYQQQAVRDSLEKHFGVLEAGTGSGKTVMGLAIIAARKQPTLILVHNKELLYQWRDRIKTFLGIDAGLIGAGKFDIQPISVGIVNTVQKHLDKLPQHFGNMVIDECHRVPSTLFIETVAAFDSRYMLGLSATPFRHEGLDKVIGWYIGAHRVKVDMEILQNVGAVLRPKIIKRKTTFWYPYYDNYSNMISALTHDTNRNELIASDIRHQSTNGGLSLVVSDRVDHLKELASRSGVKHSLLTGKTPIKKRREIAKDLSSGKTSVLFSTLSLIDEGFDCPNMDSLFLTTPIKLEGRLKQVVGRVLRPSDGKEPLVFDYHDTHVVVLKHQGNCRQKVFNNM
jgi:superfamily II DNA or RNA helicase